MEAAVGVKHLAGGEVQQAAEQAATHAVGHVLGLTHPRDGRNALGNELFVFFFDNGAVISVIMMPGRTSKTEMPSLASRSANSLVTMEIPALEMQYSPRLVEEV